MAIIKGFVLPLLLGVGILMVTFVLGFEAIIFNEPYFEWHYANRGVLDTTQMSMEDLMDVTVEMLSYLKGDRENLDMTATIAGQDEEVFGQREKDHMVDVQKLYFGARNIRRIGTGLIVLVISLGLLLKKDFLVQTLLRVKYYIGALLSLLLVVGLLFATNFEHYFTLFHEMFFSNDLWILNPRTDILINMVPYSYFYSVVMIGTALCVLMIVLSLILCSYIGRRLKSGLSVKV